MAISPQRLTIYLYSVHRAVIFAIAQLSCFRSDLWWCGSKNHSIVYLFIWILKFTLTVHTEGHACVQMYWPNLIQPKRPNPTQPNEKICSRDPTRPYPQLHKTSTYGNIIGLQSFSKRACTHKSIDTSWITKCFTGCSQQVTSPQDVNQDLSPKAKDNIPANW